MCGIVAVLRRPTDRLPPELAGLADLIAAAGSDVAHGIADAATRRHDFEAAAGHLGTVDAALRGSAGVRALLGDPRARSGSPTISTTSTAPCGASTPASTPRSAPRPWSTRH